MASSTKKQNLEPDFLTCFQFSAPPVMLPEMISQKWSDSTQKHSFTKSSFTILITSYGNNNMPGKSLHCKLYLLMRYITEILYIHRESSPGNIFLKKLQEHVLWGGGLCYKGTGTDTVYSITQMYFALIK